MIGPIRRDGPLRANDKVVYTAYTRLAGSHLTERVHRREVAAEWAGADCAIFTTDTGLVVELTVAQVHGVPNVRVAVRPPDGVDADLAAQAEALIAARTQGWLYVLASHPVSTFMRPADALLVPPPGSQPPTQGAPPRSARSPMPPLPGGGA